MADLYTVIAGIQPTAQELLEAEVLAQQILTAQFPNMDLREGTAIRDFSIRPNAVLLAMIKKGVDYYFTQNTLSGVDDTTSTDIVDAIMSNNFINRRVGSNSVINARLFFTRAKNIAVPTTAYFSPDNILMFYPSVTTTYPASSLVLDTFSNEYYVDVNMTAGAEGSSYDIGSGSLIYFSNFDPYFLRAEINYLVTSSNPTETNTQLVTRAKNAVSTRNNINQPSIDFNLRDNFNYLNSILPVGMGEPEMLRDVVQAVIPPAPAKTVSAISIVSTLATCTVPVHGYNTGMSVRLKGASVANINNDFIITVVDINTFTVVVPSGTTVPSVLPTAQESLIPTNIHAGGFIDIYCGQSLVSGLIQVTTDASGKALISGPVISAVRSTLSGGALPDTIPSLNSYSVASTSVVLTPNFTAGVTKVTFVTGTHPIAIGDSITISGTSLKISMSAISCTGVVVTATSNGHGYSIGDFVVISGVSPTTYNGTFVITAVTTNTFSFVVLANIPASGTGTMFCEVNHINGVCTVTEITSTSVSIYIPNTSATFTGTSLITSPVKFSISNPYIQTVSVVNTTKDVSGNIRVNIPKHGFVAGGRLTLANYTLSGYNGNFIVMSVIDQDNIMVSTPAMLTDVTAIVINGTETCTSVIPNSDYGFSTSQNLLVNFGVAWANSTASFTVRYFQNLDSVQAYLNSPQTRVLCGNYLARGYNVYSLDIVANYYTLSTADSNAAANAYIASLAPGAPFVVGELVTLLRAYGLTDIQLPLGISYTKYNRSLDYFTSSETGTIIDVLEPNDRTSMFMINSITTNLSPLAISSVPVQR